MATLSFVSFDNVHPDELGSADLDPETIISELEQTLLEDYSLNLKGITVAQATNPVLSSADALALGKVNTRYTDLLDVIEDKISDENFRSRILPSMAWMIDQQCVTTARMFFWAEFKNYRDAEDYEPTPGADDLDLFMRTFAGALQVETVFGGGGHATTLVNLLRIRQDWHDAASSAVSSAGRVYAPSSFGELIAKERQAPISSDTKAKQAQLVKLLVEMNEDDEDPVEAEKMLTEMFAQNSANRAKQRLELNKRIAPAIETVIDIATRHMPDSIEFSNLDVILRERLFKVSLKFAMNAVSDIAEFNSKMSDMEYGMILMEFRAFKLAVNNILKTQFKEHAQSTSDSRRAAKRAAAKSSSADYEAEQQAKQDAADAKQKSDKERESAAALVSLQRDADIRQCLKSSDPRGQLVEKFGPADAQKIIDAEQFIA
jgi:hypothetical protein